MKALDLVELHAFLDKLWLCFEVILAAELFDHLL